MTDTTTTTPGLNDKFLVLEYTVERTRVRVYLLNPGDVFEGFGGSRHGLCVRKTASLIVSESDHGRRDCEYNVNDKEAWASIQRGLLYRPEPRPIGELLEPGENFPPTTEPRACTCDFPGGSPGFGCTKCGGDI